MQRLKGLRPVVYHVCGPCTIYVRQLGHTQLRRTVVRTCGDLKEIDRIRGVYTIKGLPGEFKVAGII